MAPFPAETWIIAPAAEVGERISLDPVESAHLVRVLRLASGTLCTATDGRGSVFSARLEVADALRSVLHCEALQRRDPVPGRSLAQAILKNRALEDVLDLCAQTPLREFQPLWTERVQVPRGRDIEHQMERLRAKAVAALQQSKQSWLCRVLPPLDWTGWLERATDRPVLVCDGAGSDIAPPREAWFAIGPEGGLSPSELQEGLSHGASLLSLGATRLRATAAGFWALAQR